MLLNTFRTGLVACLCLAAPAHAITVNNELGIAGAKALGAPFDSVAEIQIGSGLCTGSLISSGAILTARHCIEDATASNVTVNFTDGAGNTTLSRQVNRIAAIPGGSLFDGNDLAILALAAPVTSLTPFQLVTEAVVGEVARMVGYGLNGLGSSGHQFTSDGARWGADNVLDEIRPSGINSLLITDFDNPAGTSNTLAGAGSSSDMLATEGTTAPGDSGGPLLFQRGGAWVIGGVLSGGSSLTSKYGDVSVWTSLQSPLAVNAIRRAGGVFFDSAQANVAAVPLPASGVLLAVGVLAFGAVARRRAA